MTSPGASEGGREGDGTVSLTFPPNISRSQRSGAIVIAGASFTLSQRGRSLAPIPVASLFNAASFAPGSSPGALATLFGSNFIDALGLLSAHSVPLPLQLGGTSVELEGIPAPLLAAARLGTLEQINFQVPFELLGRASADLVVRRNGVSSTPVRVSLSNAHPGIFTSGGGSGAVLHASTNEPVTVANPARQGEVVSVYATGLGAVSNPPPSGAPALSDPVSVTVNGATATVSGRPAVVLFSGLAPGFVGVYQVNLRIPEATPIGNATLVITSQGVSSQPVIIPVVTRFQAWRQPEPSQDCS